MGNYVIALDQGTTSSRAILFDRAGKIEAVTQSEFKQYFPKPGWVEHDAREILSSQLSVLTELVVSNALTRDDIEAIGITNQRETTVVWNRHTGLPVCNAIVWQCRRTADMVEQLCSDADITARIERTTGLVPDAYFSASKIKWILDNVEGARAAAEAGDLLFGTIDSWLIWSLSAGEVHATDRTNASRTMLFDIHKGEWDPWLCDLFDIPMSMLPEVRPSSGLFAHTAHSSVIEGVPIAGVAGDQQAALFGQCCFAPGQAKNTFGTGCFLLMNTGSKAVESRHNLITTIAASPFGHEGIEYALEGSVFMAGALIQWLRDELKIIDSAGDTERIATSISSAAGVYVVPAFTGLGAPYWDADARGAIYGLTRGAGRAHIVRASLEAMSYQVYDLLAGMEDDSGIALDHLAVDGGACRNDFLLQFTSDILATDIVRPTNVETTAAGAAYLAGLAVGFWKDIEEIKALREVDEVFTPSMDASTREQHIEGWRECVERTRTNRS